MSKPNRESDPVPKVSRLLFRGFYGYSRRLISKRFCAMRVVADSVPRIGDDEHLIVYLNHPGWWDPLVAVMVAGEFFPGRQFYAPIDAEAVEKYAVMKKLGFFALEQDSTAGLRSFLQTMRALMERTDSVVMVTPHGRFVDVRDQQPFRPGLGHVVASFKNVTVVPLAIEYTFWNESTPEMLVCFGEAIRIISGQPTHDKTEWTNQLETKLLQTQMLLKQHAIKRDPAAFQTIIGGKTGEGGAYDFARRIKSWFSGRKFESSHGSESAAGDSSDEAS